MADLYTVATGLAGNYATIGGNAKKVLGDGASGVGPYTSFGTPVLTAIKVVSATINFTTTPTIANSNMYKAVAGLQSRAEIYYVGKPTASGANQFVALIHAEDSGDGYGASTSFDGSYENIEDAIGAALGVAENDITVTEISLTGLTFA
jgi:hypothetical protein